MSQLIQKDLDKLVNEFDSEFSSKKILVTGGAGFLGSWLCDVFVSCGAEVTSLDNLSTSTSKNIEHLDGRMNVLVGNVEDITLDEKYDYIFNFASRASPDEYIHHPIETLTANSIGTMKVLEIARKGGSIVLDASTSEIYGDPQVVPTPESYYGNTNSVGIRSCYDEGKRYAEALCMAYLRQHKVDVRMVRIFNTYGPRIRGEGLYGRALPRFISQALRGEKITIYGDGKQTRSFCYVADTIRGILKLSCVPKQADLIVNIGNPDEMTVLDLAKKIKDYTKSRSELSFSPLMQDDPKRRCPDITRARHILGWQPTIGIDEGLTRTINWFESQVM